MPSIPGSSSYLEERVVPAGGGQSMSIAQLAQSMANSHAAQVVNNLFQSILMTSPTDSQLVQDVRRLQHGTLTANGLRNNLFASAQRQQLLSSLNVDVNASPQAFVNSLFTNILNQTPSAGATNRFVNAINAGVNPQMVAQRFLNTATAAGRTLNFSTATVPTSTAVGTTTTSTTTANSTGTTSALSPLQSLLSSSSVLTPTGAAVITPITQFTLSQLPVTPLTFSPTPVVNSPINSSPIGSITTVNPTTFNSPINQSPIASPIPIVSAPIVNSPINASPVSSIII